MLNICLIGYGNWGKLLSKKLNKKFNLLKVLNSKNYSLDNLKKIDWVVIATPNKTHFKIVKECIKIKKNVFCEKPLTIRYSEAVELYKLAKINRVKLIVSDLSQYKKKLLNKKINYFNRFKNSTNMINHKKKRHDLLYSLAYHDIGLLYNSIKNEKVLSIKILNSKPFLKFSIKFGKKEFIFHYNTNKKKKIYTFNNISLYQKKDIIEQMFIDYLIKGKSMTINKNKSLFVIKILEKIKYII